MHFLFLPSIAIVRIYVSDLFKAWVLQVSVMLLPHHHKNICRLKNSRTQTKRTCIFIGFLPLTCTCKSSLNHRCLILNYQTKGEGNLALQQWLPQSSDDNPESTCCVDLPSDTVSSRVAMKEDQNESQTSHKIGSAWFHVCTLPRHGNGNACFAWNHYFSVIFSTSFHRKPALTQP